MTPRPFIVAAVVLAGCSDGRAIQPGPDLSPWQVGRAPADVAAAVGRGDYRLLTMMGIGPYAPGIDGIRRWPRVGSRAAPAECIGGSDVIEPGELPLIRATEAYAAEYNRLMAAYLDAHPRPPGAATRPGVEAAD